tara:strand:- start:52 stop:948 length:897 start_codon:yes stop_codon:yes gene_type:complete
MPIQQMLLGTGGGSSIEVEDLRTELQKVGDAIKNGRQAYSGNISNPYNIVYDGDARYISDGSGDMYDSGNATYIVTENSPTSWSGENVNDHLENCAPLQYTRTTVTDASINSTTSGSFALQNYKFVTGGYGTTANPTGNSNSNTAGYLVMAATAGNYNSSSNMRIGFGHRGNLGADGSGTTTIRQLYSNDTIDGFTVYAWDVSTYNASDPTVCNLYLFLGHEKWGTIFGTPVTYAETYTDKGNRGVWMNGTQNNVLVITALLPGNLSVDSAGAAQRSVTEMNHSIATIIGHIKSEFGY